MSDRRVKVDLELDAKGFSDGSRQASQAVRDLQKAVLDAEKAATQAAGKVEVAKRREADAIGKVRVAEVKLSEARKSGSASQIAAAEEKLASSKRNAEAATKNLTTAEEAHAKAADTAAAAQQNLSAQTERTATSMEKLRGFITENSQDLETAGRTLTGFGAGLTALAAGSTKAAMDWQSDWAGVQKTNDGTHEQMVRLEGDLRNMAKTLPSTHTEIAAVAEAAGQLGVGVDDVANFTRVMIDLGETTNLTSDEAATSLARFMNITGLAVSDVGRLGSTVVGLGNNFATTEAEILALATRLAAAGTQAGMADAEIMGLATAMSDLGIPAEAGGTAMSMVMGKIDKEVREAGQGLQDWADLAGVSAQEFASAWQNDPAEALVMIVEGLGEAGAAGESMRMILADLGITGQREADTMLRLGSAGEKLAAAFTMANQEYEKNSALSEEAALRYETAASQMATAWNTVKDVAISAGSAIAPVVGNIAEAIGTAVSIFGELPEPLLGAVTGLSGIVGVAALAAGGLMMVAPRAVETWDAFQRLRKSSLSLPRPLRAVGKAASGLAILSVAVIAANQLAEALGPAASTTEEMTLALQNLANQAERGVKLDDLLRVDLGLKGEIEGIGAALDFVNPKASDLVGHFANFVYDLGLEGLSGTTGQLRAEFEAMDEALSQMDATDAAAAIKQLREEATGDFDLSSWDNLAKQFPEYAESIRAMANEFGYSATEAELLQMAMGDLPPELQKLKDASDAAAKQDELVGALEDVGVAADGTVGSLQEYLDLLFATGLQTMGVNESQRQYAESLEDMDGVIQDLIAEHGSLSAAMDETGAQFDHTTEAGRSAGRAFESITQAGFDQAQAMAAAGQSQEKVQDALQDTFDELVSTAEQFTATDEQAEALARSVMGIEKNVDIETWMSDTAQKTAEETAAALFKLPDDVDIDAFMSDAAYRQAQLTEAGIDNIPNGKDIESWMSDAAFLEALATRAAVLDIPPEDVIDSFMSSAARDEADKTTAAVLGIKPGVSVSSFMSDSARVEAMSLNSWLNTIDGRRTSSSHTHTNTIVNAVQGVGGALAGRAQGGRAPSSLPGYTAGGRLPATGLGRDQIIGVNAMGNPFVRVDDREWIINAKQSEDFNPVLRAINDNDPAVSHLKGNFAGGPVGRQWSAASLAPNSSVRFGTGVQESGPHTSVVLHTTVNNPVGEPTQRAIERQLSLVAHPELGGVSLG